MASAPPSLYVFVYTGDREYAGTGNKINIVLHGKHGQSSKAINLNNMFYKSFARGEVESFKVEEADAKDLDRFVEIEILEIWKTDTFGIFSDDWYLEKIIVENNASHKSFVFPYFRWIKNDEHYFIKHLDTSLPQFEEFWDQRKKELEEKRKIYEYEQKFPNGPVQIKTLPKDENFSVDYMWEINKMKYKLKTKVAWSILISDEFKTLDDMADIFDGVFYKPQTVKDWRCDKAFGRKRLNGINPILIRRFTEIPEKFPVTDAMLGELLEGHSIQQAITLKKLYWTDLAILEGIPSMNGQVLCNPMLLLYVDKEKDLRPVAIQLFQEPGPQNPIFTPLDEPSLWKLVKLWCDHADCCYHQALTHLGLTHLLMEGVALACHRNISPSHPIFKVLAPHFLYIFAINSIALSRLVAPGQWVDQTMAYGATGLVSLATKGFGSWRLNVEGLIPETIKERGVDDRDALPNFFWRDDSLLLFNALKKYVTSYVDLYYDSDETVQEDEEIQGWTSELVKERNQSEGGVGLKGVPGNGSLSSKGDLVDVVTSVIFQCSCSHASANFGQYETYSFPPNYPTMINAQPPTSKNVRVTEDEICQFLPKRRMALGILIVTTILSRKGTNSLGDFEVNYIFDPKAQKLVVELREDLAEIGRKIKARNEKVKHPYTYLLPEDVPNSISI